MARRALLWLAVSLAAASAACGSGGPNAGGSVAFVDPAVAPFIKYDTRPEEANLLGVQAIVHAAPFGARYGDPEAVLVGAEHRLYYATDAGRIELATSPDGVLWTRVGVVLAPSEPWEGGAVSGPTVLRDAGGFRLYYEGGARAGVGLATSADGLAFDKHPANPLLAPSAAWEGGRVGNPTVRTDGAGRFRMLYDGDGGRGVGAAVSEDGLAWTKEGGAPAIALGGPEDFDAERASDPTLLIERTALGREVFRVWYTGRDGSGNESIGAAGSFDGVSFEKFSGNPVMDEILPVNVGVDEVEPSVLRVGGGYTFLYYAQTVVLAQGVALAFNGP